MDVGRSRDAAAPLTETPDLSSTTGIKTSISTATATAAGTAAAPRRKKAAVRRGAAMASLSSGDALTDNHKRRCVSTACVACRKRKSKCDGALPSCAACASVYGTECVYDPSSDHRRKGVYKEKVDSMKARNSTLQILIEAILNGNEDEAFHVVRKIRTCDSLDVVAEQIINQELDDDDDNAGNLSDDGYGGGEQVVEGERELARKMGELRLENGSVRFIGGTSHLIYLGDPGTNINEEVNAESYGPSTDPIATWTRVTQDTDLITHLINKYFAYHYPYFTTLSKKMFYQDFLKGRAGLTPRGTVYCSSLLVNTMLALGCHFTDIPEAYGTPGDSRTKGDHFFAEAKRLIIENDEYEKPRLVTVQALALMSVREAGCAREAKGWVYSGMSFRMAQDIGLNLEIGGLDKERMTDQEIDARRITFWGCFLFDKCWSNYLGRLPLLPTNSLSVSKPEVFPDEDAEPWCPFTDNGYDESTTQPSRVRAVALQMAKLCEMSSDLLLFFYHPSHIGRSSGKAVELKKLSELHRRLEEWRHDLPQEFEPKDGQLPNVILMHMFFHLQYIHLFRPFLKYAPSASPLPAHVSPRRICTVNAGAISKLMRLYKKSWNLRQICNIAVYMTHSACTIHLLNLPEKTARRDIIHGVKHLEEIAEDWLCARRTLSILSVLAKKWNCELPDDAAFVLQRTDEKYGYYSMSDVPSPRSQGTSASPASMQARIFTPVGQRDISPMTQYAQARMAQPGSHPSGSNATMGSVIPMNGMSMSPNTPGLHMANSGVEIRGDATLEAWGQPGMPASMPDFQTPPEELIRSALNQDTGPTNSSRQSPFNGVQGSSFEAPEWFLNDSARWQQSFEAWNIASQSTNSNSMFVFGEGGSPTVATGTNGAIRNTRADSNEQPSGFEGLGTSLNGGGWLPGLD